MHPPNRGFGKPPRQPTDGDGRRPLLQGHLKPGKGRKATKPAPEAAPPSEPPREKSKRAETPPVSEGD